MKKRRKYLVIAQLTLLSIFLISFLTITQNHSLTGFTIYESPSDSATINDTYLRETFPNNNFGTQTKLIIGNVSGGTHYNSLIRDENITTIPSEDTILSGKLQFYVNNSVGTSNLTLRAYRVNANWTESQATWNNRITGTAWSTAGGDYIATEIGSVNITNQSGVYYNITITNAVRGWVNGSYNNYGIILSAPNTSEGNYRELASTEESNTAQRPKIIIDHSDNAIPTISEVSVNSTLANPNHAGDSITFNVSWTDIEIESAQTFICNSSQINTSGCNQTTFCNTSFEATGPSTCSYTIQETDNRTTPFYVAVCDTSNCSSITSSNFYVNHKSNITLFQPNGGETINQSQGNYTITFNVSDSDSDLLLANIYYAESQNSTDNSIILNLNLTQQCTDADSDTSTTNNCSYQWNSTNIYGTYYLTININDSYSIKNDTSDASFDVRSLVDDIAPNLTAQSIDSDIYSGQSIQIYATASDEFINDVWVSINTTPETNLTMTNYSATEYNISWTAVAAGTYQFKTYADDTTGNINNSMSWEQFTIRSPNATAQNTNAPSSTLPYHTIKITGELNATEPLSTVYAYLNVPSGFTFLTDYSQNNLIGSFTAGQTKTATWFLSVPITESTYSVNITYTDNYGNTWDSSNKQIIVTSSIGGGYSIDVAGYPEVEATGTYYVESNFKQSGSYTSPDSMTIILYDSAGNTIINTAMTEKSTGIYNYSYAVGAAPMSGQWETIVNATKSSISYYTNEFWKVVGALFDVRDITIINPNITGLNISVILENIGNNPTDMDVHWNLTRIDNGASLDTGSETIGVGATPITHYISPTTTYIGQVKITFIGIYLDTEKAGAYKTFSTITSGLYCGDGICNNGETCSTCPTDCGVCPVTPPSGGGGGGGTTTTPTPNITEEIEKDTRLTIDAEEIIYVTKNLVKTTTLKITNTGKTTLNNILLTLENLDKEMYAISPKTISSLKPQESATFEIIFITDLTQETDFNYLITTNELTQSKSGKLIPLPLKEYLLKELERLKRKAKIIKDTKDKNLIDELKTCEEIISEIESNIEKEEFINAKDNIKGADNCLDDIINKIKKKQPMNLEYLIWIIIGLLIVILMAIIIFVLYKLYKKLSLMQYSNQKTQETSTAPKTTIKKQHFEDKLKSIEDKLGK